MKSKQKRCQVSVEMYWPFSTTSKVCSPKCALELAASKREKEFRKETKRLKEKIKTKSQWAKEAQAAFNRFIRLRDAHWPCISCGRHHQGQYHAGHYKSVGAHPELRFEELNNHKQCAPCNNHLSGNIVNYRINLIEKIGIEKVEWLEGPHEMKDYDIDDLQIIKRCYARRAKELEKSC